VDVEEQLRAWLKGSGISPKVIGEEAGVDYSQVYKFIKGTVELRTRTFAKLCTWARVGLERLPESAMKDMEPDPPGKDELRNHLEVIREQAEAGLLLLGANFRRPQ
jgi:transcriptional regulator with XRE-family HTH domain